MEYRLFRGVGEGGGGVGMMDLLGLVLNGPCPLLICCSILRGSGRLVGGGSALVTDDPTGGHSQT